MPMSLGVKKNTSKYKSERKSQWKYLKHFELIKKNELI